MPLLTPRWTPLKYHPVQWSLIHSEHRFNVVPAGRRSGKTEIEKRYKLVRRALRGTEYPDPRFFAGAPTRDQAKRIYWDDLKALIPRRFIRGKPSETELRIDLVNGASLWVVGMDRPERIEGQPWDGGVLDEYANMKADAWPKHVRPALSDRMGWCDFIGVPEGRNHYYELARHAQSQLAELGEDSDWAHWHWISADILPPEEIAAAKRDLDDLTYQQEYEASFINFVGQAYYPFKQATHCERLQYDPKVQLAFCFDFNVAPGTASVVQEQKLPNGELGSGVIGEVWIPRNSNTPRVCRKLLEDWGDHEGRVSCYGDATGGAGGSAKVMGSDWDLVKKELKPHFGNRLSFKVPSQNPRERVRVNAVNTRLKAGDGTVRLMVDPARAPHVVQDFEGVKLLDGGSGELDKKHDPMLTHLTDGIGYYVAYEFPIESRDAETSEFRV